MKWKIGIVRLNWINYDEIFNFSESIFELYKSEHKRKCQMEYAPKITDCISSVRYLIEKNTWISFPLWWINEIPYLIEKNWLGKIIESENYNKLKVFDLLFIRNNKLSNNKKRMITHMWTYLWEGKIFQDWSHINKKIITFKKLYEKYNDISLLNNYKYTKKSREI